VETPNSKVALCRHGIKGQQKSRPKEVALLAYLKIQSTKLLSNKRRQFEPCMGESLHIRKVKHELVAEISESSWAGAVLSVLTTLLVVWLIYSELTSFLQLSPSYNSIAMVVAD
jgi:hypothetical protein